jgi:hypothetical protein
LILQQAIVVIIIEAKPLRYILRHVIGVDASREISEVVGEHLRISCVYVHWYIGCPFLLLTKIVLLFDDLL